MKVINGKIRLTKEEVLGVFDNPTCPKCNEVMYHREDFDCYECECGYTQIEDLYQQRLSKMLEKLNSIKWNKFRIIYVNNYFSFECKLNTRWRYLYNPTLNGVEQILKDMEAK